MFRSIIPCALGVLILSSSTALASDKALEMKVQELEKKVARLEALLEKATQQVSESANTAQIAAEKATKEAATAVQAAETAKTSSNVVITMKPSPTIASADGKTSMSVFGLVQADAAWFNDDVADHPDGTTIRRAVLGVKGNVAEDWDYKAEIDFADNSVLMKDVYLGFSGVDSARFQLGHFKEPFSLEVLMSDKNTLFIERAALTALAPARNIGFQGTTHGEHWTATAGIFGDDPETASSDDEQYSVTGRVTYAPVVQPDASVHFALAGSHRKPDQATDSVRYRERPEVRLASMRSVDTGTITGVEDETLIGLEAAASWRRLMFASEYVHNDISREALPSVDVDAWYVQAGWLLTDDTHPYKLAEGVYDRVTPTTPFDLKTGGMGAWEIAARYSNLDLNDMALAGGGEMENYTLGLNWYPTANLRFMANYIIVDTDSNSVTPDDSPEIFALRGQVDF